MKTIKAIVVDDEENARLIIKNFIADYCPTVEIIDEAEDVKSAVKLINKNQVDLVFLDIEMPQFDIIVSNPPYVCESEKAEMRTNVLDFEPHLALFVPNNNSLIFYERIARK